MPNIMATNVCNLSCSYCFGHEQMFPAQKKEFMTEQTYIHILRWLKHSRVPYFHLMGGEPTLHPQFLWMLKYAAQRKFVVDVFSNGITSFTEVDLKTIKRYSHHWIINVNDPRKYPETSRQRLESLLKILGKKAVLTFNIITIDYDPSFLLTYIDRFKLNRSVKIGIALPTVNKKNVYAKPEEFPRLSQSVFEMFVYFHKHHTDIEFECGVPYCFFSEDQRKTIDRMKLKGFSLCNSILDILPDGRVIYCLPLAQMLKIPYNRFRTYQELCRYFEDYYRPYRGLGFKKECLTCSMRRICAGSCLARAISTFKS